MAVWSTVRLAQLSPDFRIDAEYYRPDVLALRRAIERSGHAVRSIDSLASSVINFGAYSLCNFIDFQEPDQRDADAVRFVTAQDIQDGFIDFPNARWIPAKQHTGLLWKSQVSPGQVLVAMAARLGHAAVFDGTFALNSSQDIAKITISAVNELDPYYLSAYINSSIGRGLLLAEQTGSVQQHTNLGRIKGLRVVKPPRGLQLRVRERYEAAISSRVRATEILVEAEHALLAALGLDGLDLTPSLCYSRPFKDLVAASRFDAEYFSPRYQRVLSKLAGDGSTLDDVAGFAERRFDSTRMNKGGTFRYIEIGSLTGEGQAEAQTLDVADAPSRAQWIVEAGDVITSTVRPIRRLTALIGEDQHGCVCSSGFAVLRPKEGKDGVEPEVLLTYLRLPIVCEIMDLHTTASMYPAIPVERLLRIPFALPKPRVREEIVERVRASFAARQEAAQLLDDAKRMVDEMVLGKAKGGEK